MSNIIKSGNGIEYLSVTPFDWSEMAGRDGESIPKLLCDTLDGNAGLFARNPSVEEEESIQYRMLEAERRAQQLEKEAYEKAYAEGHKDGLEYGRKHMSVVQQHLETLLESLEQLPNHLLNDYRDWLIDTCLTISRQVVRRELKNDTAQLAQLIETLLKETGEKYTVTVHLNPKDLDLFEKYANTTSLSERAKRKLAFKPDADIERGGCRLESGVELIDATVEKQFALIEQALRNHELESDATSV